MRTRAHTHTFQMALFMACRTRSFLSVFSWFSSRSPSSMVNLFVVSLCLSSHTFCFSSMATLSFGLKVVLSGVPFVLCRPRSLLPLLRSANNRAYRSSAQQVIRKGSALFCSRYTTRSSVCRREANFRCITHTRRKKAAELPFGRSRTGEKQKHKDSRSDYTSPFRCCWTPPREAESIAGETLNASLLVLPSCQSLTRSRTVLPTILCHHTPSRDVTSRGPLERPACFYDLLPKSTYTSRHFYQISLKLKEHIHTTSIYTFCVSSVTKISPLGFFFYFFLCVSLLPTIPHTRD